MTMAGENHNNGAGPINEGNQLLQPTTFPRDGMFNLPIEMREAILDHLSPSDLKTLRLVCSQFSRDVDLAAGIHLLLDTDKLKPLHQLAGYLGNTLEAEFRNWVSAVNVRTLAVTRLSGDFETKDLVANPFWVRSLSIQLIESEQARRPEFPHFEDPLATAVEDPLRRNLTELLTTFNNVTLLKISYTNTRFKLWANIQNFLHLIFKSISLKSKLETVELKLHLYEIFSLTREEYHEVDFPTLSFPTTLRHLKIESLYMNPYLRSNLESLFGAQEQLRSVDLYCPCMDDFECFSTGVRRSAPVLRQFELSVRAYWGEVWNRENCTVDLSILAESNQLERFVVIGPKYRSRSRRLRTKRSLNTTNFDLLPVQALHKVQFHKVHLRPEDLVKILLEPINLKHVSISDWTLLQNPSSTVDRIMSSIQIAALIGILLPRKRIQTLFLHDYSFARCPFPMEETVAYTAAASEYKFSFSLGHGRSWLNINQYMSHNEI